MVGPKPLKIFKPKTHEWIGLRAHETKGRKKKPSLPRSLGTSVIRTEPGYPEIVGSSGFSGRAAELG